MAFYITITLRQDNCVQISIFVHYAQGKTADPGRCLEKQRTTIERQIEEEEQLLLELEVNLDSMNINVPTLPAIGNSRLMCGNCHHRGHRNQVNQPCTLQKCTSYTYCGCKDKHPEYFSEMNKLKAIIKKKRDEIKELQEQLTGLKNFISQSEHQFIKALTPRMIKVDQSYKLNKQKLLRDIRILKKFYNGKIPAETTNDAEQLKITLSKCKKTLEQEVGEVAVYGIRDYERSKEINAINFNVNMNVSPENKTTNSVTSTSNSINASSACGSETIVSNSDVYNNQCDESEEMKRPGHKSGRARKLAFKRKRKHKYRKKHNVKYYYSSSSSDSESESSSSYSSEDSESGRFYISRRKHKKLKSKQRKNRIDVTSSANNSATTGPNLANVERQRENLLFVPTPYFQNYGAQSGLNYYNHRNQVPGFNYSVPEQILSSNLYQLHETSGTNQNMLLSMPENPRDEPVQLSGLSLLSSAIESSTNQDNNNNDNAS